MKDKQGILRGGCTVCPCTEYIREDKQRCKNCNHVPTKHKAVGQRNDTNYFSDWESEENLEHAGEGYNVTPPNVVKAWDNTGKDLALGQDNPDFYHCQFPGCYDMAYFDLNTGQYTSIYCYNHLSTTSVTNCNMAPNVSFVHPQPDMMFTNSG